MTDQTRKCVSHHYACDCREQTLNTTIRELRAENTRLRKDAMRYRWLLGHGRIRCLDDPHYYYEPQQVHICNADIDAAMEKLK